mmetsp:Transcript_38617/g.106338  ORF Transcript_38617/g.106338 Transcript_38617/m.106338 type:complete len:244 (+) Transcript_38617:370-1101(+)
MASCDLHAAPSTASDWSWEGCRGAVWITTCDSNVLCATLRTSRQRVPGYPGTPPLCPDARCNRAAQSRPRSGCPVRNVKSSTAPFTPASSPLAARRHQRKAPSFRVPPLPSERASSKFRHVATSTQWCWSRGQSLGRADSSRPRMRSAPNSSGHASVGPDSMLSSGACFLAASSAQSTADLTTDSSSSTSKKSDSSISTTSVLGSALKAAVRDTSSKCSQHRAKANSPKSHKESSRASAYKAA